MNKLVEMVGDMDFEEFSNKMDNDPTYRKNVTREYFVLLHGLTREKDEVKILATAAWYLSRDSVSVTMLFPALEKTCALRGIPISEDTIYLFRMGVMFGMKEMELMVAEKYRTATSSPVFAD